MTPNLQTNGNGRYLTSMKRQELEKNLQDLEAELLKYQKYQEEQKQITKLKRQITRIRIMLLTDEGKSQTEICQELKCSHATARHWISIAKTGDIDQWNECCVGRPNTVKEEHLSYLKQLAVSSPREFGYSFHKWTGDWLSKELAKKFGIKLSKHHINRLLKQIRPIKIQDLSSPKDSQERKTTDSTNAKR